MYDLYVSLFQYFLFLIFIVMLTLKIGKAYCFSKCDIKLANAQFSNPGVHGFEMTLNKESTIQRCSEADSQNVPDIKYAFTEISEIVEKAVANDIVGECVQSSSAIEHALFAKYYTHYIFKKISAFFSPRCNWRVR